MILRAVFWIALISLFIPHEPDLGFGRPGGGAQLAAIAPADIGQLIKSTDVQSTCSAHRDACAGGLSILDGFQRIAIRSMDEVRADLAANGTKLH